MLLDSVLSPFDKKLIPFIEPLFCTDIGLQLIQLISSLIFNHDQPFRKCIQHIQFTTNRIYPTVAEVIDHELYKLSRTTNGFYRNLYTNISVNTINNVIEAVYPLIQNRFPTGFTGATRSTALNLGTICFTFVEMPNTISILIISRIPST